MRSLRSERTLGPFTAEEADSFLGAPNRNASVRQLLKLQSLGPRKGSTDTQYGGADESEKPGGDDAASYQEPAESDMAPPPLSPAKSAATFVVVHLDADLDDEYEGSEVSGS